MIFEGFPSTCGLCAASFGVIFGGLEDQWLSFSQVKCVVVGAYQKISNRSIVPKKHKNKKLHKKEKQTLKRKGLEKEKEGGDIGSGGD